MTIQEKQLKNSRLPAEWLKVTQSAQEKTQNFVVQRWKQFVEFWTKLPALHRTIILMLCVLVIAVFLFPARKNQKDMEVEVEVSPPAIIQPVPDIEVTQENVLELPIENDSVAVIEPTYEPIDEPIQNPSLEQEPVAPKPTPEDENLTTDQQRWYSYEVLQGDTLANIFRNQQLSLLDLYAIAAIEGNDRPLSRIRPKQELRFRLNAAGDLDALQIQGRTRDILFVRTEKGDFIRKQ